jgi:hypothetical protein
MPFAPDAPLEKPPRPAAPALPPLTVLFAGLSADGQNTGVVVPMFAVKMP